ARLVSAGIDPSEAEMDAELLACRTLGWDRARLITSWRDEGTISFAAAYDALIDRRARREPISQILGEREFWDLPFIVTPDVLTPRPETEGIIEAVLDHCRDPRAIVDVGTGSGCLAVTLAREFPRAHVTAVDVSPAALAIAERNAARHGVLERVSFLRSSMLEETPEADLVVSNPPYVPDGDRASLPAEVRDHEPPEALFAGVDGLDRIRDLIAAAPGRLRRGGWLVFECGVGQERAIRDIMARAPALKLVAIRPDLAGIPRTVIAERA
ncbi:MAG TPA: peptide chain release factor N(5)-glutamine methyltransferase, partial [Gemmatimonadaceae bacterium]|nr:peptide chain release factor N(5)-glutamine methyltransferase [Gemmatimonadaceae bacterium]